MRLLAAPAGERPQHLTLAKDMTKSIKQGHPWIYKEALQVQQMLSGLEHYYTMYSCCGHFTECPVNHAQLSLYNILCFHKKINDFKAVVPCFGCANQPAMHTAFLAMHSHVNQTQVHTLCHSLH